MSEAREKNFGATNSARRAGRRKTKRSLRRGWPAAFFWTLAGLGALALAGLTALHLPRKGADVCAGAERTRTFYVRTNGYHTSILLPADTLHNFMNAELPDWAQWLSYSWGDSAFYTTPGFSTPNALRALSWPSEGIMHVRPLRNVPFDEDDYQVEVCAAGYDSLRAFIRRSFLRDAAACACYVKKGWGRAAKFYRAAPFRRYTLFYTCNSWTAEALRAAGRTTSRWNAPAQIVVRRLREKP